MSKCILVGRLWLCDGSLIDGIDEKVVEGIVIWSQGID